MPVVWFSQQVQFNRLYQTQNRLAAMILRQLSTAH